MTLWPRPKLPVALARTGTWIRKKAMKKTSSAIHQLELCLKKVSAFYCVVKSLSTFYKSSKRIMLCTRAQIDVPRNLLIFLFLSEHLFNYIHTLIVE